MGNKFILEGFVENDSASVDSTMLKDVGSRWHKSDMNNNYLPIAGIDTDAKWGLFQIQKLGVRVQITHVLSTGKLIVSLSANISTTANIS